MLIYIIRNRFDGKVYIGKHKGNNLQRRWRRHIRTAEKGSQSHFHRAIRKYGIEAFELSLLSSSASSPQDLNEQERFYIAKHRANDPAFGYNMTTGGEHVGPACPWKGRKLSAAWRKNLGLARKGKKFSDSHRQNLSDSLRKTAKRGVESPRFGKPLSRETRIKISEANKGKVGSNLGKKFTDEHKKRIAYALKGRKRVFSVEWRRKLSLARRGNQNARGSVHSDEWKTMMSEKMKGNQHAKKVGAGARVG